MHLLFLFLSLLTVRASAADNPEAPWDLIRDEEGISVYQQEADDVDLVAFKAKTVIQAPLDRIMSVLCDINHRKEWMPMLLENRLVRKLSEFERIEYMAVKTPPLVANRDFVFRGKATWSPQTREATLGFFTGDDGLVPPSDDFVRGKVLGGGYVLHPLGDGSKTETEYTVRVDPRGSIPAWIVNLVSKNAPFNTLVHVREQVMRPDLTILPEVKRFVAGFAKP